MSAGNLTRVWTPAEVRSLGVRTDLVTACEIAYGAKRTKAYLSSCSGATIEFGRRQ